MCVDVTSSCRSERAVYTPGLSMLQVQVKSRGEALYHEEQDTQDANRTQEWITIQLAQARLALQRHIELQRLLRKSKDARSRDHIESFRPELMPDWIRACLPQSWEDETELSR